MRFSIAASEPIGSTTSTKWLAAVLRGHYAYFGIRGNTPASVASVFR
jgi:hypothetical protein